MMDLGGWRDLTSLCFVVISPLLTRLDFASLVLPLGAMEIRQSTRIANAILIIKCNKHLEQARLLVALNNKCHH